MVVVLCCTSTVSLLCSFITSASMSREVCVSELVVGGTGSHMDCLYSTWE